MIICDTLKQYLCPLPYLDPCLWVERNIDLTKDKTAARMGMVDLRLTPYLRDPLNVWARTGRVRMTCLAVEQTGKSSVWKWGLLWRILHLPAPALIVYPSDADAADTNTDSFEPIMRAIPPLGIELERYGSRRKDCFRFSQAPIYFSGGGSDIISKPLALVVGDEVDFWVSHLERVDNIKNLDKRTRTFNDSLRVLVCSPTERKGSPIWREFQESSQGYWHLRCCGCGKLSMRSADVHNMQWESDEDGIPIDASIRLICPECKREHLEAEKREMNINGGFIHLHPERVDSHIGFQWGALASQFPGLSWHHISRAQAKAGKSGSIHDQKLFDNSFRGLPFAPRKSSESNEKTLTGHISPLPTPESIKYALMSCDTQDDRIYWVVRGWDERDNSYLLASGCAMTLPDLETALNARYMGQHAPKMLLIDSGGHRTKEIGEWVAGKPGVFMYKGRPDAGTRWRPSKDTQKLILANPYVYQSELLYYIYAQHNRTNNYWNLHPDVEREYLEQMLDLRPDNKKKAGHDFANWTGTGNDHFFDCEKMMLILVEMYRQIVRKAPAPAQRRVSKVPIG